MPTDQATGPATGQDRDQHSDQDVRRPVSAAVRGDWLSCYTTAASAAMEAAGIPHRVAIGAQLLLGVRREAGALHMLHQHTPLTGDGVLFDLPLERCGADGPEAAGERIAAAADRWGAVVVTGDTHLLPWVGGAPEDAGPHWFAVRPAVGGLEIDDVLRWSDDLGDHGPYRAVVTAAQAGGFARSPARLAPVVVGRERWALGDGRPRADWDAGRPWQWLEPSAPPSLPAAGAELLRETLSRSADGVPVRPDVAAYGWRTGPAAFAEIAAELDAHGHEPACYALGKDLWVAARSRLLFQDVLLREGAALAPELGELGAWMGDELLPRWTALIRALRYSAIRAERGIRPQASLFETLDRIAALEEQVRARLRRALAGGPR